MTKEGLVRTKAMSRAAVAKLLEDQMDEQQYLSPTAVVAKQASFKDVPSSLQKKISERYRPKCCDILFKDSEGALKSVPCTVFQLGFEDVTII